MNMKKNLLRSAVLTAATVLLGIVSVISAGTRRRR